MRAWPLGNSVNEHPVPCGKFKSPATDHVSVQGLYVSLVEGLPSPPATSTRPSARTTPEKNVRGKIIEPVGVQRFVRALYTSDVAVPAASTPPPATSTRPSSSA